MLEKFPEILLVDVTFKLIDLRIPVHLLIVVDGDGLSETVALFILADEAKIVIESTVNVFKKHNESWLKTHIIMSHKDFNEGTPFQAVFHQHSD